MKKYVLVGASTRGYHMFIEPMVKEYSDCARFTGVFDTNPGRSEYIASRCPDAKVYTDFDLMISEQKPNVVIVATVDAFHSDYIIRAMELGCDVIAEKPMTIDATRCKAILDAEKKTQKKVTVTFNYRYTPYTTKIKQLIHEGAIGDVYSVHFEWLLDQVMALGAHGASYFRRWNRYMDKSGGLLVHKSTHHFDIINWWLNAVPQKVSAFGRLNVYGRNGSFRGVNCRICSHVKECPFFYKLTDFEKEFYAQNELYDGYYKDSCVFAEDIDIYDTMAVNVLYNGGQMLSYSLSAAAAYEGWTAQLNGSKGRLEAFLPKTGFQSKLLPYNSIKVFDLNNNVTEYKVARVTGDHGGGDERIREHLFRGGVDDPLGHFAGTQAGADSVLIGAAANISIKEGKIIDIAELMKG